MTKLGPYDLNQIYCGNCADLMAQLPDECIDLVVTSPPYDNLREYNGYVFDFEPIAQQLWRVIKVGGVVVWVVGDATVNGSETLTSFRQAIYFQELGFNVHDTMIYESNKPPLNHNRYEQCFEYMFVFSKRGPSTFHPIRIPINQFYYRKHKKISLNNASAKEKKRSFRVGRDRIKLNNTDRIKNNFWKISGSNHIRDDILAGKHPAVFPEALARDHIISWSNPGDLVFDPMCGSGTTCKMAKEQARNFLGFDISEEYCELSRRRVGGG